MVSVVTAIASVTLKRAVPVITALMLTILAVAGILMYLKFIGLAFVYLIVLGGVATSWFFGIRKKNNQSSEIIRLESQPRTGRYFIMALLVFIGSLFLIAHTDVWQYSAEVKTSSFTQLLNALINNYILPVICLLGFVLILSLLAFLQRKREKA